MNVPALDEYSRAFIIVEWQERDANSWVDTVDVRIGDCGDDVVLSLDPAPSARKTMHRKLAVLRQALDEAERLYGLAEAAVDEARRRRDS